MSLWCQRLHNTKLCLLWDIFQGEAAASGLGASEGSYQGDLQESWGGRWLLPTVYVRCRDRSRPGRVFSVRSCSLSSTPPPPWDTAQPPAPVSLHSLLTKLFCAEEGWPKTLDVNEERRSGGGQTRQTGDCLQHLPPEVPATAFHVR